MATDMQCPGPAEKCWNCRRRRLKCDGTVPACTKCLKNGVQCRGYGTPLKWVGGVASRGLMKDATFEAACTSTMPQQQQPRNTRTCSDLVISVYKPQEKRRGREQDNGRQTSGSSPSPGGLCLSPPLQLTEPIFQDLDYRARFLLDYYNRQVCPIFTISDEAGTPYRDLIRLVGSSEGVTDAMMAVSALHAIHGFTGSPVILKYTTQNRSGELAGFGKMDLYPARLLELYISLKQKSLKFLSQALKDPSRRGDVRTFGTAVLLILLEAFETGSGSWMTHLEGAKSLLEFGDQESSLIKGFSEELMLFEIFGSTMGSPGVVSTSLTMRMISNVASLRPISTFNTLLCPVEILRFVAAATEELRVARRTHDGTSDSSEAQAAVQNLEAVLAKLKDFDAPAWALNVVRTLAFSAKTLHEIPFQICIVWQLAATVYISRILYYLTKDPQYLRPLVDDLISAFEAIGETPELKFLTWPAFIVGVAGPGPDHRLWTINTLDMIWRTTFAANGKAAQMVLAKLWEQQDARRQVAGEEGFEDWNCIHELSMLTEPWILF